MCRGSVADLGSGAFLTPGFGMGKKSGSAVQETIGTGMFTGNPFAK
jgi:hypothetical protein